eukprot:2946252-Prorocentrum_lima.AAC.1
MTSSLVGSEMCIRDRKQKPFGRDKKHAAAHRPFLSWVELIRHCRLYTSDAADDMQCVDLGGR